MRKSRLLRVIPIGSALSVRVAASPAFNTRSALFLDDEYVVVGAFHDPLPVALHA